MVRQLKTQIEDLESFVHSCRSLALQLMSYYLLLITLRLEVFPMMHFSVLVAVPHLRSLLDGQMTQISCAGNASSTNFGAAGQNSAALNGAGVSPSRSPGRSGPRRKSHLSQPTSACSCSSRMRYPGALVEAESSESVSRELTRRSNNRCATPH